MIRSTAMALCLVWALGACSEETDRPAGDGGTGSDTSATGKEQLVFNENLLAALEVRWLKGRCVGRVSITADDADARAAVLAFARALVASIPLDGSKPTSDDELKALVPADNAIDDWAEDPTDTTQGPWLTTTNARDWINGGNGPFDDNGFETVAGEGYVKPGSSWELTLEMVNMGSTSGAEAAFKAAQWDQGTAP
jgi:hypothetical protein